MVCSTVQPASPLSATSSTALKGFVYPKTVAQPAGAVRLMRKYSVSRDDHAIFPENEYVTYLSQGYSENSGSDWIRYVYPNTNGTTPAIQ